MLLSLCLHCVFLFFCSFAILPVSQLHSVPYLVSYFFFFFSFFFLVLLQPISYAVCPFVPSLYLYGLQFQSFRSLNLAFCFSIFLPRCLGSGWFYKNLNRYFAENQKNLTMAREEKWGDHQSHSDSSSVDHECLYKMSYNENLLEYFSPHWSGRPTASLTPALPSNTRWFWFHSLCQCPYELCPEKTWCKGQISHTLTLGGCVITSCWRPVTDIQSTFSTTFSTGWWELLNEWNDYRSRNVLKVGFVFRFVTCAHSVTLPLMLYWQATKSNAPSPQVKLGNSLGLKNAGNNWEG